MKKRQSAPQDQHLPPGLYIIATPIGNIRDITLRALDTLQGVDIIACEDTRESGKLAAAYDIDVRRIAYHDHNAAEMRPKIIDMIKSGQRVALISDSGMPLVSDPGYKLVDACLAEDLSVTCLPGASASLAALVLSGLPSDRFMFTGFLPPKTAARKAALQEIAPTTATLVFYETAPRLLRCLADMQEILGDRPAVVARELTKKFEEVRRGSLSALVAHYTKSGPPKGEIAIVIGAAPADMAGSWGADAVDIALQKGMQEEGLSLRDAAALVAARSGRRKSDVYARALQLTKGK